MVNASPQRGGFHRTFSDGSPRLVGQFIQSHLPDTAFNIYTAYKGAVQGRSAEFDRIARRRIKNEAKAVMHRFTKEKVKLSEADVDTLFKECIDTYISGGRVTVPGGDIVFRPHRLQKKRSMSYNSFQHYIYILTRIGLIKERVWDRTDVIPVATNAQTESAQGKSGSGETDWHQSHPSVILEASGSPSDSGWSNPWEAYHSQT